MSGFIDSGKKQSVDFIIAGQGLAGSLLAFALLKHKASVLIVDPKETITSSKIAAGIMHPVTGRRLVKSWMADQLIPFSFDIYKEISKLINADFFHHKHIVEIYQSNHHRNDWLARSGEQSMQQYIGVEIPASYFADSVIAPYGGITIQQTAWMDVRKFVEAATNYFSKINCLIKGNINESEIHSEENKVTWKNISAKHLIFCNGYNGAQSTFFKNLPFLLSKGEIIEIECNALTDEYILNKGIYIVPSGNKTFKVGATFSWDKLDQVPSQNGKNFLVAELNKILKAPYKIINHSAAIRPTTQDRRPFIGLSKTNPLMGIFNGMGTKGVMMAPYFAAQFAGHLLFQDELDAEVSVLRF